MDRGGGGGPTSCGKSHKFYTSLKPYHYHNYILWLSSSSSLQPYLEILGQFILPAEEIVVTVVLGVLDPVCTVL